MREPVHASRWSHHFLYRSTHLRTTWKLRLGLLALLAGILWLTSGWWTIALARSLVCESDAVPSDAILIENFDPDYLLFERAAELRRKGLAPRVLVPVREDPSSAPNLVGLGNAKVMADVAHLDAMDVVPYREV